MPEKKEEKEVGGGGSMDKPSSPPHIEDGDLKSEPSTHKESESHDEDGDLKSGPPKEPRKESTSHVDDNDLPQESSTHKDPEPHVEGNDSPPEQSTRKEPAPHVEDNDPSSGSPTHKESEPHVEDSDSPPESPTQQLEPTQSPSPSPSPSPLQSQSHLPDDFPSSWKCIPRVRYMPGMPASYFYISKEGHIFDTLKQARAFLRGEEVKTHFNVPVTKTKFALIDAPASPYVWSFDTDAGNKYGPKRPWEHEDDDTRTTGFENYTDTRIDGGMHEEEMPPPTTHRMWSPDYDAWMREYDYYGPQYPYSPGYAEERNGPQNREQYARMSPPEYKRPKFGTFEGFPREYQQNTGFDRHQGAGVGTSITRTENGFVNYPRDFQGRESALTQAETAPYPRTNPPWNPSETHLQQAQKESRDSLGGSKESQSIFGEQKGLSLQEYPNGLKPSNTGNQQKQLLSQQESHQKGYMILNKPKELNPSTQSLQDTQTNPDIEPYKILPPPPPPLPQPPPAPKPPQASQEDGELPRSFVDKVFSDVVGNFRSYSRDMSSGQRGSSIRFKNDVMMNSIAEALDAIRSEKSIFVEVPSGSEAFKDVIRGTKDFVYRRGTMAILDRVWNIFSYPLRSKYYSIPPEKRGKEVLGFHSSKVSNLIGIAKEGFHVNSSEVSISTGKKEMLGRLAYTADDCKNAIKYSDEFTFCLVVTIFEGRVYNANSTMEDMTLTKLRNSSYDTIHAERVSRRGSMRASPPERILPRQLLMFRKVKREDLWIYVRYNLRPMDAAWLTVPKEVRKRQSEPPNVELRKRIAMLMNRTHALWNVRQKNQQQKAEPMTPFLVLQTNKYACFSSRDPVASIHLVVVPKARTKWTDLTPRSAPVIIELYAYAMFVKGEFQRIPQCPQLSILFPVCPSQDQVHCHIMAKAEMNVGFNALKYNNFVPVEVFVYNLVHGKYDKMWYNNNKSENRDYWD